VIANIPIGGNIYRGSLVLDINPSDFGTKLISVGWSAINLDYNNSVNQIYMTNGTYFGGMGMFHYAPTTGSCSGVTTIVAGNIVQIIGDMDNTV